ILLAGYLGVAFLQKFHVLPAYVGYARTMMANGAFFYFITMVTAFIITAAYFLVQALNFHVHQMLDETSNAFDSVIKGTIASIGHDFFVHLARNIVESLKIRCVLVGELSQKNQSLRTLAVWKNTGVDDGFEIPLSGTVFEEVVLHSRWTITRDLNKFYPANPLLAQCKAEFFFGIVLIDSRAKPIGMLCLVNDFPLYNMYLIDPLVTVFASRASAELERKLAEDKRTAIEMQLAQAQKMEALGQLVGGIAHDFNNMVSSITGYAYLLRSKLDPDSPHQKYIQHIITAGGRTANLVGQLTQFARRGMPDISPVNVHELLDETIIFLDRTINRNIEIVKSYSAQQPVTAGDATFLQNVFLNLGINARDAMEENGGTLAFSTSDMILEKNSMLCQSFQIGPGEYLCVDISDTGVGMSKEVVGHLFEPFFTTKAKGKGTGLGLANVWGYIENFKGAIQVKSEEGKGSTFTLFLPLADATVTSPAPRHLAAPRTINKILVVDDEPGMREICSEILASGGYTVSLCENGVDAVDFMKKEGAHVDMVILDMIMPRMNGHDTFYELRKIDPALKIILVSGFLHKKELKGILKESNAAFIQKPFTEQQLLGEILSLAARNN
ncbi:MAG: response regulator, partial [Chitinivibrionales bacterium]